MSIRIKHGKVKIADKVSRFSGSLLRLMVKEAGSLAGPNGLYTDPPGDREYRLNKRIHKCIFCHVTFIGGSNWIQHENGCLGIQDLCMRTIKKRIQENDPIVLVLMETHPAEVSRAANELLREMGT